MDAENPIRMIGELRREVSAIREGRECLPSFYHGMRAQAVQCSSERMFLMPQPADHAASSPTLPWSSRSVRPPSAVMARSSWVAITRVVPT